MLQISQRPLTASDADAALFVDRVVEVDAIMRSLSMGLNILVLGPPGSGRTSLLRMIARRMEDSADGRPPVFIDAAAWTTTTDVVAAIREGLGDDIRNRQQWTGVPKYPELDPEAMDDPLYRKVAIERPRTLVEADIRAMASAARRPRTVLVDGVDPLAAHTLFGRFRDTLWEFDHRWIVTGELNRRAQFLQPPADVFFETVIELGDLTVEAARELLERRISMAGGDPNAERLQPVVARVAETVQTRTPRNILSSARLTLLTSDAAPSALDVVSERQARAAALGRPAAMLYAELENLGPVHAGDERLLNRLGYTRSRVVQLLKQLEEKGLVVARVEGRRKLYAIPTEGGVR